jgi:hypothetical protein
MNHATIRSMMRWMPTNGLPNSTHPMSTSRHVFSCYVMARPMDCQGRQALHSLKTCIRRHTRLLEQLDLLDLNGATLVRNLNRQDHLQALRQMDGEADLLRLIHHLSLLIHTTSETQLVALGQSHLHHVLLARGKSSK